MFDEKWKEISKIQVFEVEEATFEVTERKTTTGVGDSELKWGYLCFFLQKLIICVYDIGISHG